MSVKSISVISITELELACTEVATAMRAEVEQRYKQESRHEVVFQKFEHLDIKKQTDLSNDYVMDMMEGFAMWFSSLAYCKK